MMPRRTIRAHLAGVSADRDYERATQSVLPVDRYVCGGRRSGGPPSPPDPTSALPGHPDLELRHVIDAAVRIDCHLQVASGQVCEHYGPRVATIRAYRRQARLEPGDGGLADG